MCDCIALFSGVSIVNPGLCLTWWLLLYISPPEWNYLRIFYYSKNTIQIVWYSQGLCYCMDKQITCFSVLDKDQSNQHKTNQTAQIQLHVNNMHKSKNWAKLPWSRIWYNTPIHSLLYLLAGPPHWAKLINLLPKILKWSLDLLFYLVLTIILFPRWGAQMFQNILHKHIYSVLCFMFCSMIHCFYSAATDILRFD